MIFIGNQTKYKKRIPAVRINDPRCGIKDNEAVFEGESRESNFLRSHFSIDADRIMHSFAFTRYLDKTQVFYFQPTDFTSHRVIHVNLLNRIARSIGNALNLNCDLIEAIALGHDIGHAPFGHFGERCLSDLMQKHNMGIFCHNLQSYEWLQNIELREDSKGEKRNGLYLTLQTLDGIVNHNGEKVIPKIKPTNNNSFKEFELQIKMRYQNKTNDFMPATLEGCVVRYADLISYISRDIEDAKKLDIIKPSEVPKTSLGTTHSHIIENLVNNLIKNSNVNDKKEKKFLAYDKRTLKDLELLYSFNRERIYLSEEATRFDNTIHEMFEKITHQSLKDIKLIFDWRKEGIFYFIKRIPSLEDDFPIFKDHLALVDPNLTSVYNYDKSVKDLKALRGRIVRDYIAGMTDRYFLKTYLNMIDLKKENIKIEGIDNKKIIEIIQDLIFNLR